MERLFEIGVVEDPIIYATLITNGYAKLEMPIPEKSWKAGISLENMPSGVLDQLDQSADAFQDILNGIDQIPIPELQVALLDVVSEASHIAYGNLFIAAATMCVLILPASLILSRSLRKRSAEKDDQE